jgi:transcriptional regulator with XRE-family HTH domain
MPRSRKSRYSKEYRELLELLERLRSDAGITQVELAKRMRTSQSMLSKLERGVVRMDISDLLDYLSGIGADPIQFMKDFLELIDWDTQRKLRR